jgi:hypothetical protein
MSTTDTKNDNYQTLYMASKEKEDFKPYDQNKCWLVSFIFVTPYLG